MNAMASNEEKNVLVTGASRGIGKAIVQIFAENDYNVIACAKNDNPSFRQFCMELQKKTGRRIEPYFFDLHDEKMVKESVKEILSIYKTVDVLINNAGIAHAGTLNMCSMDTIRNVYEINVFAQILIMQMVSRKMIKQKDGCIINMCSVGGIETSQGYLAYGSSKAAMIWVTKSVARELAPFRIRVNGIAPGLIDTEMGHYKSEEEIAKVFDRMSIKRMGQPDEIAKAALYLASEDAAYMTGQIMILDGGRV